MAMLGRSSPASSVLAAWPAASAGRMRNEGCGKTVSRTTRFKGTVAMAFRLEDGRSGAFDGRGWASAEAILNALAVSFGMSEFIADDTSLGGRCAGCAFM